LSESNYANSKQNAEHFKHVNASKFKNINRELLNSYRKAQ